MLVINVRFLSCKSFFLYVFPEQFWLAKKKGNQMILYCPAGTNTELINSGRFKENAELALLTKKNSSELINHEKASWSHTSGGRAQVNV